MADVVAAGVPVVRVVRGNPTDEELAALMAVLAAVQVSPPVPEVAEVMVPRPRRPTRFVPATTWQGAR
ncbi:acyl-CoA carboxylase epsilon subunit [Amycolatopsis rhabdoformis]|uniref:Acyl-CoA carboxylase epsilon subunit n=1 Tax=Amycolatopsis rhabdoformis TaxID=1448059 RepID=A0ABZ1HY09_9PSEU|nr:acyl-CoA carboxylase epsilon subunit [Amycolatopsis rhabdoformis]WSE26447.1 acyl-CoA carboxylase epsilon subunit [Amycolatopsis rhabdoformis]